MECKIDHTLAGAIPRVLCRICTPRTADPTRAPRTPGAPATITADLGPAAQARYEQKQKRKLRAEVKAWRARIETMERCRIDPRDIAKAKETLHKAETDLYMIA
jgi:phytoene dehydrogenase-like protein